MPMKPITQQLPGRLYPKDNALALLLDDPAGVVYLRYALVVGGPERHVLPAVVLDDWGHELKTLDLYRWIDTEGQRFPRAELFGYEMNGAETQYFLRDLEIFFRYPCYVYPEPQAPVPAGILLQHVLQPDPTLPAGPQAGQSPASTPWPLHRANVQWWRANPHTLTDWGFTIYQF